MMSEWEKFVSEGGMWNDVSHGTFTRPVWIAAFCQVAKLVIISIPYKASEERYSLCFNLINIIVNQLLITVLS